MKKYIFLFSLILTDLHAQNIYTVQSLSNEDLSGNARYVALGGAMNYLGANLSTFGSNPASSALYRRNDISLSTSFLSLANSKKVDNIKKNTLSFDQAGFVYSSKNRYSPIKYTNIGFNYQKKINFRSLINTEGLLSDGISQSITAANLANLYGNDYLNKEDNTYDIPLVDAAYNSYMINPVSNSNIMVPSKGKSFKYSNGVKGGVQEYDFNISLNIKDKFYTGIGMGIHNVNKTNLTYYTEELDIPQKDNNYYMISKEALSGTGFNALFGFIYRPFKKYPLRFGLSLSTPIWYQLTGSNTIYINSPFENKKTLRTESGVNTEDFDFTLKTPFKINIGLATIIHKKLAFDIEYEFKNLASSNIKYPYDQYQDYVGRTIVTSYQTDNSIKSQINKYLKNVHTLKIGAEYLLSKHFSIRGGYNFISAPIKKDAFLNLYPNINTNYTDTPSLLHTTSTDYINLYSLHRESIGLGFSKKSFYMDLTYLHEHQNADVYPFHDTSVYKNDLEYYKDQGLNPQKKVLTKNKIILTLGFRF